MRKNLLSLGALEAQVFRFSGEDGVLKVSQGSMTVFKGERVANLYRMKGSIVVGDASVSTEKEDTTRLWHMRLGHISERGLQLLHQKGALSGIKSCKLDLCEFCILGRQRRVSFSTSEHMSKGLLDLIHTDVWGPSPVASVGGAKYFVTFIADFSRKVWIFFLKHKSEVFQKFKEWRTMVENQRGRKVKTLRSDNGGEYTSTEFKEYLARHGIKHQLSIPGRPEQNGVAERMNRTLMDRARSIRLQAGMPEGLWAEAVNHAAFLINRSPPTAIDLQIPQKRYGEEKLWTIRPYGYLVARHTVWSIVIRGTSWRRNQGSANSLVSLPESRDSDSGIPRQVLHSLAEMWSLMRSRC